MTSRLLVLHLRGRRVGWISAVVIVVAVLRRIVVPWTAGGGPFATTVSLLLVVAAGAVVTAGIASPFGDAERSAGGLLPRLRITQLAGTVLLAGAVFALAAATGGLSVGQYLRDVAGLVGMTLLAGSVLGAHRCWTVPLGYVVACAGEVDLGQSPMWAWPILPVADQTGAITACVLLVLGVAAVTAAGLPDRAEPAG